MAKELNKEQLREANQRLIAQELAEATKTASHMKYKMSDMPHLIEDGQYTVVLSMIKNRATHCKFGGNSNRSKRAAYLRKLKGILANLYSHVQAVEWADRYIYNDEFKVTRALLHDRDKSN